jgi:hypothetical protein
MVGIEWRDKVVGIEWRDKGGRGGEWTGEYEGTKTFERGTFDLGGAGRIFGRLGDCIGAFSRGGIGKTIFLVLA